MHRLLKESKCTLFLIDLSRRSRILYTILFIFVLTSLWFSLSYLPLNFKINRLKNSIKSFSSQVQTYNKSLNKINKQSFDKIKLSEQMHFKSLMSSFDSNNIDCNIDFINKKKNNFYNKKYFSFKGRSVFKDVISFLENLEDKRVFINVKNFELINEDLNILNFNWIGTLIC